MLIIDAPEGDTHLAIMDLQAPDLESALRTVWASYQPGFARALKLSTPTPANGGWDSAFNVDYETSPNEQKILAAFALQKGNSWTIALIDGSDATIAKRGAALNQMVRSAAPLAYQKESFADRKPQHMDAARIAKLRSFLEEAMELIGIPGAGFAILDQNQVVYEGGVGVRKLGQRQPVDAHTRFLAASNTKGMSTLLLSTLVDEGKLRWNQPVQQVFPSFQLGSADVSAKVEVRHLVCACTGLPRQDFEWIFEYRNATPDTSLKLLSRNSPTSGFGEVFQYNNLMASAAGYIGGHLVYPELPLGAAYDKAMQKRIFDPLGMQDSTFDMARGQHGNYARPHGLDRHNKVAELPMTLNYAVVPHRPAGGVWTSAHDLIRYVQLEANQGKLPDGRQLVSAENLLMRRQPQVSTGNQTFYGMGLSVDRSMGVDVVHHGGSLFGYKSDWYLLPDAGIGAVLLTNSEQGRVLLGAFQRRLLELVYDGEETAMKNLRTRVTAEKAEFSKNYQSYTLPAQDASRLARRYHSKELGELKVRHQGKELIFDFGEWQSGMASRKNADGTLTYLTLDQGFAPDPFEFTVTQHQGKRALVTRDGQHDYFFVEQK
ncbi:serine hydrolase [Pseudoduganella danionis]|uniref:Serine hydrolase n=1 Tax=Pseudoduganella danionis TaxID=1890295 RepID=A0ABW9SUD5_9BURK|nr:serine hydrolase [Pseudoduganella danionis]